MSKQRALARVGIAKQTAKGTPNANATFAFGVRSGAVVTTAITQDREDLTVVDQLVAPHANREGVLPGAGWTTRVFPESAPLLVFGALGAITTAGVGPFTHTIVPATALPYLTVFGELAGEIARIDDAKVDELTISWAGLSPPEVEAKLLGTAINFGSTFGTVGANEARAQYLTPAGGTYKLDVASATPVTARITDGSVKIGNGLVPELLSDDVLPDDVFEGTKVLDVSLKLMPADFTDWRKAVTGAAAGTSVSKVPVYGSFEFEFVSGTDKLKFAATRVAFAVEFPDADPSGGPVEVTAEGQIVLPASGAALTVTAINDTASY